MKHQQEETDGDVDIDGFELVTGSCAVVGRSRAGGIAVYRNNNSDNKITVTKGFEYADERGEYAAFTVDDHHVTVIDFYLSPKLARDAVVDVLGQAIDQHQTATTPNPGR